MNDEEDIKWLDDKFLIKVAVSRGLPYFQSIFIVCLCRLGQHLKNY